MYVAFFVYTLFGAGPLVGAPLAALVLATLGIVVYFGLVRHMMKGPMLAQILGTFGLALVLRYAAFWAFAANFVSLPENLVGGTFEIDGPAHPGVAAAGGRGGPGDHARHAPAADAHLARIEDAGGGRGSQRGDADGHPPRPHAGARLGDRRGSHRLAGALIAMFFYIAPTVGESLALIAFVMVSLGGFGWVPGALVAGLRSA